MAFGQRPYIGLLCLGPRKLLWEGPVAMTCFPTQTPLPGGVRGGDIRRIRGDSDYLSIPTQLCAPKRRCRKFHMAGPLQLDLVAQVPTLWTRF
jgi:hypothetical protein